MLLLLLLLFFKPTDPSVAVALAVAFQDEGSAGIRPVASEARAEFRGTSREAEDPRWHRVVGAGWLGGLKHVETIPCSQKQIVATIKKTKHIFNFCHFFVKNIILKLISLTTMSQFCWNHRFKVSPSCLLHTDKWLPQLYQGPFFLTRNARLFFPAIWWSLTNGSPKNGLVFSSHLNTCFNIPTSRLRWPVDPCHWASMDSSLKRLRDNTCSQLQPSMDLFAQKSTHI